MHHVQYLTHLTQLYRYHLTFEMLNQNIEVLGATEKSSIQKQRSHQFFHSFRKGIRQQENIFMKE